MRVKAHTVLGLVDPFELGSIHLLWNITAPARRHEPLEEPIDTGRYWD
ncbi:hypothetical protein AB4099_32870 [Bosea sp. 2KB_26]